ARAAAVAARSERHHHRIMAIKSQPVDTIAAQASAGGAAGVAVIRISGPRVAHVARHVLGGLPPARQAVLRTFRDYDGCPVDQGLALYFPAPGSFTGEPVLELQGHGSPVLVDALLERLTALGV